MKVQGSCNAPKLLNASDMETLAVCQSESNIKKCQLLVSSDGEDGLCHLIDSDKKRKRVISWPFVIRRTSPGSEALGHLGAGLRPSLFDQPLSTICSEEDMLPKPILDILRILYWKGPSTEGIFRKTANEKTRKKLKEELNSGRNVVLENEPIHLLAAIFKDFLRNIPQKLLMCELHDKWMIALEKRSYSERTEALKEVADKLPQPNRVFLKHLLCVLHHISKASAVNRMDSSNLAICVGPSMLDQNQQLPLETQKELTNKVKTLVEFLIDNCSDIFGEDTSLLFSTSDGDLLDKSEVLSPSQQNDSDYESTDCSSTDLQDHHVQEAEGTDSRLSSTEIQPHHPRNQTATVYSRTPFQKSKHQLDRRYSEPDMFSSQVCQNDSMRSQKLTKSEESFLQRAELEPKSTEGLRKQITRDLYLTNLYRNKKPPNLTIPGHLQSELPNNPLFRTASNGSLDSSSPASDTSVFSSPLTSPSISKRNGFTQPQSFPTKTSVGSDTSNQELKRQPMSFSGATRKKELSKTQSCSIVGFHRGSFKRDSKRERHLSCRIVQGACANSYSQMPVGCQLRPRLFSADEVFRFVDQKNPGKPPSYKEATQNCLAARFPSHSPLTVQNMRSARLPSDSQTQCPRPNRDLRSKVYKDIFNDKLSVVSNPKDTVQATDVVIGIHRRANLPLTPQVYRLRTMSGSYQKNKQEYLTRRCSQPNFDHVQSAKESYV